MMRWTPVQNKNVETCDDTEIVQQDFYLNQILAHAGGCLMLFCHSQGYIWKCLLGPIKGRSLTLVEGGSWMLLESGGGAESARSF